MTMSGQFVGLTASLLYHAVCPGARRCTSHPRCCSCTAAAPCLPPAVLDSCPALACAAPPRPRPAPPAPPHCQACPPQRRRCAAARQACPLMCGPLAALPSRWVELADCSPKYPLWIACVWVSRVREELGVKSLEQELHESSAREAGGLGCTYLGWFRWGIAAVGVQSGQRWVLCCLACEVIVCCLLSRTW